MKTDHSMLQEKQNILMPMLLTKLWVFLSLNYILCDLLTMMEADVLRGLFEGNIAGIPMSQGFLLFAGISLEIPFLMVVLSAVLPNKVNRRINIVAAILMTIYQLASFFFWIGLNTPLCIFFSDGASGEYRDTSACNQVEEVMAHVVRDRHPRIYRGYLV